MISKMPTLSKSTCTSSTSLSSESFAAQRHSVADFSTCYQGCYASLLNTAPRGTVPAHADISLQHLTSTCTKKEAKGDVTVLFIQQVEDQLQPAPETEQKATRLRSNSHPQRFPSQKVKAGPQNPHLDTFPGEADIVGLRATL